ncbi:MAG: amidohydrolase family protein [Gemmataceae bacterium]
MRARRGCRTGGGDPLSSTTLVGDISGDGGSWDAIAASGIRGVVFRELLGLPEERAAAAWTCGQRMAATAPAARHLSCPASARTHAGGRWLACQCAAAGVPLATHLAETADELELLAHHDGLFVPFLQGVGAWAPEGLVDGPAEVIDTCRPARTLLVHANYLDSSTPVPATATVVYCPRTHAAFGHPPHPLPHLLARGVRVALGTDSRASNPDLNLLAEARYLRHNAPELPASSILRMATLAGAEALGWADETGSLERGKSADLITVALPAVEFEDPHDLVLASAGPVVRVMVRGRWLRLEPASPFP